MSTQEAEACCYRRLEEFFTGYYLCNDESVFKHTVTGAVVRRYREKRKMSGVVARRPSNAS